MLRSSLGAGRREARPTRTRSGWRDGITPWPAACGWPVRRRPDGSVPAPWAWPQRGHDVV